MKPDVGSDHFLQCLEGTDLDDVVRRLGLEHHLFAGEGVDALACRTARLVLLLDLHETGDREGAGTATTKILLDQTGHALEYSGDFLAGQAGVFGDGSVDLALGARLDLGGAFLLGGLFLGLLLRHGENPFLNRAMVLPAPRPSLLMPPWWELRSIRWAGRYDGSTVPSRRIPLFT